MIRIWLFTLVASLPIQVRADSPQTIVGVIQALQGTQWQGTFSYPGSVGSIRINFLSDLSASDDLRYFHTLVGSGVPTEVLGTVDKACQFTPRSIHLTPGPEAGTETGTILIYACADSAAIEKSRNNNSKRTELVKVPISQFILMPNGQLIIQAKIGAVNVNYQLTRQTLDQDTLAPAEQQPYSSHENLGAPPEKQEESAK